MTIGKMTALGFALVGAFALGVWTGPHITNRADPAASAVYDAAARDAATAPRETKAAETAVAPPAARRAPAVRTARVDISAPALHDRLKPVLNKGANITVAAEGFSSAEQFATVAHAARNTEVPFLLLKHRVLNERKSLAQAIRESKPEADAAAEAKHASTQAREDIESIAG